MRTVSAMIAAHRLRGGACKKQTVAKDKLFLILLCNVLHFGRRKLGQNQALQPLRVGLLDGCDSPSLLWEGQMVESSSRMCCGAAEMFFLSCHYKNIMSDENQSSKHTVVTVVLTVSGLKRVL